MTQTPEEAPAPDLTAEAVAKFSALAQDPKLGEKFTLGDREFTRQFLTIDAEQDLIEIVLSVVRDTPKGDLYAGFLGSIRKTKRAAAIILADQDPTADEAWLSAQRGITTNKLIDLVFLQVQVNEITTLLGKALAIAGISMPLAVANTPK